MLKTLEEVCLGRENMTQGTKMMLEAMKSS